MSDWPFFILKVQFYIFKLATDKFFQIMFQAKMFWAVPKWWAYPEVIPSRANVPP